MKTKFDFLGLGNLIGNIIRWLVEKSQKKNAGQNFFFRNDQQLVI